MFRPVIAPRLLLALVLLAVSFLCAPAPGSSQTPPNVLVLVLDDLGMEHLAVYGIGNEFIQTPSLDSIAADGLVFENAWADPVCSASRAALLTGRFPFRTGIGESVQEEGDAGLPLSELTLAEALRFYAPTPYSTAAFGKWHLGMDPSLGGLDAPANQGFEHFEGTEANLEPVGETYYDYTKITDGVAQATSGYLTSDTIDWTIDWVTTVPEPWFAYVAFHAPHSPVHMPDPKFHHRDPLDLSTLNEYRAMAETLDTEIGRLLAVIDRENTVVIAITDNGSAKSVTLPPFVPGRSKQTPFEGGVRVPLLVGGGSVASGTVPHPVNAVDLFATVVEIAGVSLPPGTYDGVSLAPYFDDPGAGPVRAFNYTEKFSPNGFGNRDVCIQAARNDRYKYLTNGVLEGFIDLENDPYERVPLRISDLNGEERAALTDLRDYIGTTLDAACCDGKKSGESCFFDSDCCSGHCDGFFSRECR